MVKRKNIMKYAAIFIFLLYSSTCKKNKSCEDGHKIITIVNNSSLTINWRHFDEDSVYRINGNIPADDLIVLPQKSDIYGTREDCWDKIFTGNYSLYFFIFNNDSVQSIGWQAISGTNRGLLKKVKVDLNYLKNTNYTITYP